MEFEWDEAKRRSNMRKHGIDFSQIVSAFDSPMFNRLDNRQDYGEERWIGLGIVYGVVMVITYTERKRNTIRIISARMGKKHETKEYYKSV